MCPQFCFTDASNYAGMVFTATFQPGETTANACIPIIYDDIHECLESFTLELNLTQAAIDLYVVKTLPYTAHVLVQDDDG